MGSGSPKDHARVEAYGAVDELNSTIGVLLALPELPKVVFDCLTEIQHELFDLGGELCIPGSTRHHRLSRSSAWSMSSMRSTSRSRRSRISFCRAAVRWRRRVMWRALSRAAPSAGSGLWGGCETVNSEATRRYLNRLSDLLFVIARVLARHERGSEVLWRHDRGNKNK